MKLAVRFNVRHSVLAILFLGQSAYSALACGQLFESKKAPVAHEEVKLAIGSDKLTKLARSNAPQSWAWFKSYSVNFLSKDILRHQGMIDGDPHNGNFGPMVVNGKVKWKSLDYDDAGTGPFILDYAKFLISIKAVDSVKKVKASDLWEHYLRGLKGKEYVNPPPLITEFLNMSAKDFRNLEVKKAGKFSVGDKLLNDGERSTPIADKKTYNLIMEVFRRNLPEGMQVMDVGGREKEGGGSGSVNGEGGVLRFVALVKGADGRNTIYELKQDSESGIKNYQAQSMTLQEVLDFHVLGKNSKDKSYQEVNVNIDGDKPFVLRPKPIYFYDYANKAKTMSQFAEFEALSHYNAWYKGYMHGQQKGGKDYLKALQADTDAKIFDGLKDMTWEYLEYLQTFLPK
ncbi:MAG: hypothetical protein V4654_09890 [Bdellovibrionota bacterium]